MKCTRCNTQNRGSQGVRGGQVSAVGGGPQGNQRRSLFRHNLNICAKTSSSPHGPLLSKEHHHHPAAPVRHLSTILDTFPFSMPTSTHFFTQTCQLYFQKCFKSVTLLRPRYHHPGWSKRDHLLPSLSQWPLHGPTIFSTCPMVFLKRRLNQASPAFQTPS